jgi:hypothetical protein
MEMKKKRQLTYRGEFEMSTDMWEKSEIVRLLQGAPGTHYQEADDANKVIMRDWVRSLLQKGAITVTFVKADGAVRDMNCTLNWDQIPADKQPQDVPVEKLLETKKRKQPDEHSLRVFDLEKQEWRSFRFDRLQKITAEIGFTAK